MPDSAMFYRVTSPLTRLTQHPVTKAWSTVVYGAGTVLEPTAAELAAFRDCFATIDARDIPPDALRLPPPAAASAATTVAAPRINPELYAIIKRANAGTATADEHQVAGDILDYMEKQAQGTATPEDTAAVELVLTDFGMPLFL